MPMVQAKCENCGGILAVDSDLKVANCPFCGTAYVVQDSINYYNSTVSIDNSTIHNVQANVVNINDERSSEGRLKAADAYMQIKKFDDALREYKKVTELTPQNYRGWQGLIEAYTQSFTRRIISQDELKMLRDYSNSLKTFAPPQQYDLISGNINDYISSEILKNQSDMVILEQRIKENIKTIADLRAKEKRISDSLDSMIKDHRTLEGKIALSQYQQIQTIRVLRIILAVIGALSFFAALGTPGNNIVFLIFSGVCIVLVVFLFVWKAGPDKIVALNEMQENETKKHLEAVKTEITRLEQAIADDQNKLAHYS